MRILIGAGGTGGHIYPGLAIANTIKEKHPQADIRFVGTARGMENTIVPNAGYPLETIRVKGFERKLSMGTLKSIRELFLGMGDARRLLKEMQPDLVIGMGGYVCGPLLVLASRMGIPTVIHEQNAYPGATNRLLSGFVDKIAISFPEALERFHHREKVFLCGNPVRKAFFHGNKEEIREKYGYENEDFVVVSMGGSLGAATVNNAVLHWLSNPPENKSIRLIHITGKAKYDNFLHSVEDAGIKTEENGWFEIWSYTDMMHEVMALADVVVSRAGAMSVAEIAATGTPSILVPFPFATGNHQEFNARTITDQGGGMLVLDKTLKAEPEFLKRQLEEWAEKPDLLAQMETNTRKASKERADEIFYEEIRPFLKEATNED